MNWCKEHWDRLREAIDTRGLSGFVAKDGYEAAANMAKDLEGQEPPFDPLMGCWVRLNHKMLESLKNQGRVDLRLVLMCPMCLLVQDGQPHLVDNWINGVTDDCLEYAQKEGMVGGAGHQKAGYRKEET